MTDAIAFRDRQLVELLGNIIPTVIAWEIEQGIVGFVCLFSKGSRRWLGW